MTAFLKTLNKFGTISDKVIQKTIQTVTCDNAANNNVLIDELSKLAPFFRGLTGHTRYFILLTLL